MVGIKMSISLHSDRHATFIRAMANRESKAKRDEIAYLGLDA